MALPRRPPRPERYPNRRTELVRARERLGLDRPQFAEKLGVDRSFVWKVEMGVMDCRMPMAVRWVEALGPYGTLELFRQTPSSPAGQAREATREPAA